MEKYKVGKVLGDGTFGSVTKATNNENGLVVAIKKMKKSSLNGKTAFLCQRSNL